MKSAVWGMGSIGSRHYSVLENMGHQVASVSSHLLRENNFTSIEDCLDKFNPEYIIVSKITGEHFNCLQKLDKLNFKGHVLVEKPLFISTLKDRPTYSYSCGVGYNLRFHPFLIKLKKSLANIKVDQVMAHCGQYLPDWRPGTNYRDSYSASKEQGGGVLRDLSHELDYLNWIFGLSDNISGSILKLSDLEIETEDTVNISMTQEYSAETKVELNYTVKVPRRTLEIKHPQGEIFVDFIKGSYSKNGEIETIKIDRNHTYTEMHLDFLNKKEIVASYEEGYQVLEMIQRIENSKTS